MATIIKRGDNYQVKIRLKGFPPESATFTRKTDAKVWVAKRESEIRDGKHLKEAESKRHIFADMIDRFIKTELPNKPKSYAKQKMQLNRWKKELGQYRLFDVTAKKISEVKELLLTEPMKNGKTRSPSTVVRYMAALSPVYTIAVNEWEWLDKSPMAKVKRPSEPKGRDRFLSDEERTRLLNEAQKHSNKHLYPIVVLAISTGMRQSEIMGLEWAHCYLADGYALIYQTKNDETRRVPITCKALEVMTELESQRTHQNKYVFFNDSDYKPTFNHKAWEDLIRRAEIDDFRFHDLRHTCASYLAMNGASLAEIAEVLGHKTLNMVKRYAHLSHSHTSSVVEPMNQKFLGS